MQRPLAHRRLERKRFLLSYEDRFRKRADGRSWPRWRNTVKAAHHYHEGLLTSGARKNMQNLAKREDVPEDQLEQFIRESPWDYQGLQDELVTNVPGTIRSTKAGLLIDDFGIAKQGSKSVGVQRQYSGTLGKEGNCQVAVNLVLVAPGEQRNSDQKTWPLGTQLYLPESWVKDKARREEARVPAGVQFRTKPQIALDMLTRVRTQGVEHAFIGGDAGYGAGGDFRAQLRAWKEPYVLGVNPEGLSVVPATVPLVPPAGRRKHPTYPEGTRVELAKDVFQRASWEWVEWGVGSRTRSKNPRGKRPASEETVPLGSFFYREQVRVVKADGEATDEVAWLLLEKRKDEKGRDEFKAYICWGMGEASLRLLAERAHLRWAIEQFHKEGKQLLGLDRFEGRTWQGWHHHVSMVLLAYAFLSRLRAGHDDNGPLPSLRSVAMAVEWEIATQTLMEDHALERGRAKAYAGSVLRKVSDWFKPRK